MATTGTAAGSWPYRRIVLAALSISVVLNLFFIAGAVWTRMHGSAQSRGPEQRNQRFANELDFDAKQRAGFEKFVVAMRARSEKAQQQVAPLLGSAWEEAAKPQADQVQVLRLFDEAFDKRQQSLRDGMVQTLDFLSTLSPEQRAKFVALARERRGLWRGSTP